MNEQVKQAADLTGAPTAESNGKPARHVATNRLIRQLFAFVAAGLLVAVGFWSMSEKRYELPAEGKTAIEQAMADYYGRMIAAEAGLGEVDPLNPHGGVASAGKPADGRVKIDVISARERKSSGRVIVRFRVTFDDGPAPDGIQERTMTLTRDGQGKFTAGPVPAGVAPALP